MKKGSFKILMLILITSLFSGCGLLIYSPGNSTAVISDHKMHVTVPYSSLDTVESNEEFRKQVINAMLGSMMIVGRQIIETHFEVVLAKITLQECTKTKISVPNTDLVFIVRYKPACGAKDVVNYLTT